MAQVTHFLWNFGKSMQEMSTLCVFGSASRSLWAFFGEVFESLEFGQVAHEITFQRQLVINQKILKLILFAMAIYEVLEFIEGQISRLNRSADSFKTMENLLNILLWKERMEEDEGSLITDPEEDPELLLINQLGPFSSLFAVLTKLVQKVKQKFPKGLKLVWVFSLDFFFFWVQGLQFGHGKPKRSLSNRPQGISRKKPRVTIQIHFLLIYGLSWSFS